MFELTIKNDMTNMPKSIETNVNELEAFIKDKLDFVKGIIIDPNNDADIIKAEADMAVLNKMKKAVSEQRLTLVKMWTSPIDDTIARMKACEKQCDEVVASIKEVTKKFRDDERMAKMHDLSTMWEHTVEEMFGSGRIVAFKHFKTHFEKMCNEKTTGSWTNRGKAVHKIQQEMIDEVKRCYDAYTVITTLFANDDAGVKSIAEEYIGVSFDVASTVAAVNDYKRRQEVAQKAREEYEHASAELNKVSGATTETTPTPQKTFTQDKPLITCNLSVTGTFEALTALKEYGKSLGIVFKNLDKKNN